MPKQVSEGQWACEYPGCNYKSTKEGYVRNHEKLKHGGINYNETGAKGSRTHPQNGAKKCPDCKGENIRLLNTSNPEEKAVKAKGYKYICDDCEEVLR